MALIQVSARLNPTQRIWSRKRPFRRAPKGLGAKTTSETLQRALHDRILQRYSSVGKPDAFGEDH